MLETTTRIIQLGGDPVWAERVASMRVSFEARTGKFAPEDPWFEERSRAFWNDAVTRGGFARAVHADLSAEERQWLPALEAAHRGLFRADGRVLVDVWSGAEFAPTVLDDESRAELDAAAGQLFDARLVGAEPPFVIALLPGAFFHAREATAPIHEVLAAARATHVSTDEALDALLRMERTLRSLARVKADFAYRPDALSIRAPTVRGHGVARGSR